MKDLLIDSNRNKYPSTPNVTGLEYGRENQNQASQDTTKNLPPIIQGGMGVGISNWKLARTVSVHGQFGVVSGTALDELLIRRLQTGDEGGHMRRALKAFPDPKVSNWILERYFIESGKNADEPFVSKPMPDGIPNRGTEELLIVANFVEVFLAKEGHLGQVGINYLLKIQTPLLASLYGAMLAEVDAVFIGAGIPVEIPPVINGLARHATVSIDLSIITDHPEKRHKLSFTPPKSLSSTGDELAKPMFFPIVSSAILASLLVKKLPNQIDGIIIEKPSAGGHNAPPRGNAGLTTEGEPKYRPRDEIKLNTIRALGIPFWLAGSYGSPEKLTHALSVGAAGIQVGTIFAFCKESGLRNDLKHQALELCQSGEQRIFRDPVASPTGFPFQVLSLPETISEPEHYKQRSRQCDLGYLRESYEKADGSVGWRCRAENPDDYVRKGGKHTQTVGRKCLCNGLMANIGLAQVRRKTDVERPLVTCGCDLKSILRLIRPDNLNYTAVDVITFLLSESSINEHK